MLLPDRCGSGPHTAPALRSTGMKPPFSGGSVHASRQCPHTPTGPSRCHARITTQPRLRPHLAPPPSSPPNASAISMARPRPHHAEPPSEAERHEGLRTTPRRPSQRKTKAFASENEFVRFPAALRSKAESGEAADERGCGGSRDGLQQQFQSRAAAVGRTRCPIEKNAMPSLG